MSNADSAIALRPLDHQREDQQLPAGPHLSAADFHWFRARLHRSVGIALQPVKQTMVAARLGKRLRQLGLSSYAQYRRHLESSGEGDPEWREFINALTTNKTDFFREPQHFDLLTRRLLPSLRASAARRPQEPRISIWSAGCSTGEEPYTISMALRDAMRGRHDGYRIMASDVDTAVLQTAERGIYRADRLDGMPNGLKSRNFIRARNRDGWQVCDEVRAAVRFQRINLIEEPWPLQERFDAIFCRNVIIYFDRATQLRLFERFARQLAPGGYLFIGHSESLLGLTDLFERVEGTVYRLRQRTASARAAPSTPRPDTTVGRRIIVGETFASGAPSCVSTVLGSCVSVCLFDPLQRVGGMNHFLLPDGGPDGGASARYGAYAMDLLINELMKLGADRSRVVAKVFGAAHTTGSPEVSRRNREFVRQYLAREQIPVLAERLGADRGMEVRFETHTGRARFRYLPRLGQALLDQERQLLQQVTTETERTPETSFDLFRSGTK
ncbi:MAG: CheR family methyltransferase [Polyangia bacterium]